MLESEMFEAWKQNFGSAQKSRFATKCFDCNKTKGGDEPIIYITCFECYKKHLDKIKWLS